MTKLNVINIINLKQVLNHRFVMKKVYKVIKFNRNVPLKPYIDMYSYLSKKSKNWYWKRFFKLMNIAVLEKLLKIW